MHRAGVQIEAAEDETLVLGVQGVPAAGPVEDHGITLDERAERADAGELIALLLGLGGVLAELGEPGVDPVDVLLLDRDLLLQDGGVAQFGCAPRWCSACVPRAAATRATTPGGNRTYSCCGTGVDGGTP